MLESTLAILAATGGVAMGLAPILQMRQMQARSSSQEVSLGFFLILFANFLIWVMYGATIGNIAIIIPNLVATFSAGLTIVMAVRLRRDSERSG